MNISINPSYFCNFDCSFCYLTKEQLRDRKTASIESIKNRLDEVSTYQKISYIDIYGGEVALLGDEYLFRLIDILQNYCDPPYSIITNLSKTIPAFSDPRVRLSVSYDFEARQSSGLVLKNMSLFPSELSVLILASKNVLEMDVEQMISSLSLMANVISVEIKPYSKNQANQQEVLFSEFEAFVQKWISSTTVKNFLFINEQKIKDSLTKRYGAFSDDHIYITPNAKFGILDFDEDDNEFFRELDHFKDYQVWARKEKEKVTSNKFCSHCNYLGSCLTEHYREVKGLTNSCNGFIRLLDWYGSRHESIL